MKSKEKGFWCCERMHIKKNLVEVYEGSEK